MYKTFRKFFAFCGPADRRKFYVSIVLSLLASFFGVLKIQAVAMMLTALGSGGVTDGVIWGSLGLMLLSVLGASALNYRATMLQTEAGYGTAADKRMEIAEHLRYLPMGFFNANSLGRITSVTTNTMENLADVGTRVVMLVTGGLFLTAAVTVLLFLFDWRIGLVTVCGLLLFALVNARMQRAAQACSEEKVRSDTAVVEKVLEYIRGIAEVKAYHLSGSCSKKLEAAIEENAKANTGLELALVPYMTVQNGAAKLIGAAISLAAVCFFANGTMAAADSILMVICSFVVTEGLQQAGMYSSLLRVVDLSVSQAGEILALPAMDISGSEEPPASCELRAEHISFAYGEKEILRDVSLKIPQGTATAIVGPSGSGKTTLCNLLARFWDVDRGIVTLGGRDIRSYSMDALMQNFSFVFQSVYLFRDTIANNIRFGQPEASMEAVIAAAKKARCHDFILALPDGYDTVIGENGSTLSGGERQRLSIARAIMKDAPIIVLDEATANIDPENEQELLEALAELTREKTLIMIAHRLKTVRGADQILVLEQGRLVQSGTHAQLMEQEGVYRRFVSQREQAVGWKL